MSWHSSKQHNYRKLKIAFCLSGETRSWNENNSPEYRKENPNFMPISDVVKMLQHHGHQVDLYGHTWDYCEKPGYVEFKELKISNKDQEIGSWLREDLFSRAVLYNENFRHFHKVKKNNLNNLDPQKYIDSITESSVASWSQIFSNNLCMEQIHWDESYDIVIRSRWDLIVELSTTLSPVFDLRTDYTFLTQFLSNMLVQFANGIFQNPPVANLLLTGNSWMIFRPTVSTVLYDDVSEDTFFALKVKGIENNFINAIKAKSWKEDLHLQTADTPISSRCCSHQLWSAQWSFYGMIGYYGVPPMFCLRR